MSFLSLLKHRATIRRNTPTNVDGVMTPSWSSVATNVRCLIQEQLGQVQIGRTGNFLQYDAIGFFLPSSGLRPLGSGSDEIADQVIVNGTTYTVLHVGDEAGMGHHHTAKLRREATS